MAPSATDSYSHVRSLRVSWTRLIKSYIIYLWTGVEACAALIPFAALQATFQAIHLFFVRPPKPELCKTEVRLHVRDSGAGYH
jgi:hypothetical protein